MKIVIRLLQVTINIDNLTQPILTQPFAQFVILNLYNHNIGTIINYCRIHKYINMITSQPNY